MKDLLLLSYITTNSEASHYWIKVKGQLDSSWSEWFEGLTVVPQPEGDTIIYGIVADQAALFGILERIHALGLALLSVSNTEPGSQL